MRIFLSVGDLSGDIHCAELVAQLLRRHPDWQIFALGGKNVEKAGATLLGDTSGLGVIGFSSALAVVPRSLKLRKRALRWIGENQPDLAILCDWGGFNTRLLAQLQAAKIPICYYFPPRSWQKKGDAGTQIAPFCEVVATPFEWSAHKLQRAGAKAVWVGHPILEKLAALPAREELRARFAIKNGEKLLALLPGSRAMELASIGPHVAGACEILKRDGLKIVAAAPQGGSAKLRALFPPDIEIVEGQTLELLRASDAAIVKSGTSTLEAAAANCPQVVVYEMPRALHWQVKLTGLRKKIPFVSMPNIIAERAIVPELLGESCRAANIAAQMEPLLFESSASEKMRQDYGLVRDALGARLPYTATLKTAELIEKLVS